MCIVLIGKHLRLPRALSEGCVHGPKQAESQQRPKESQQGCVHGPKQAKSQIAKLFLILARLTNKKQTFFFFAKNGKWIVNLFSLSMCPVKDNAKHLH